MGLTQTTEREEAMTTTDQYVTRPGIACQKCNGNGYTTTIHGTNSLGWVTGEEKPCSDCRGYGRTEIQMTITPDEAHIIVDALGCIQQFWNEKAGDFKTSDPEFAEFLKDKAQKVGWMIQRFV